MCSALIEVSSHRAPAGKLIERRGAKIPAMDLIMIIGYDGIGHCCGGISREARSWSRGISAENQLRGNIRRGISFNGDIYSSASHVLFKRLHFYTQMILAREKDLSRGATRARRLSK